MGNTRTCANYGKSIWRNGKGADWYHRDTASTACQPGQHNWRGRCGGRTATPVEVSDAH